MSLTKATYSMISGAVVNALDFGMSTTATAAANKTALLAAIASTAKAVTVFIPEGQYQIAGDIVINKENVEIFGSRSEYTYNYYYGFPGNAETRGTMLLFTSGAIGFDVSGSVSAGINSDNFCIKDIVLDGGYTVPIGIQAGGFKKITDVTVARFTNIGIYLGDWLNSTVIDYCGIHRNGTGIKTTTGFNTTFTIRNSIIRSNGIGVELKQCSNVLIDKCTIESNTSIGLYFNPAIGETVKYVTLNTTWFENNNSPSGSSVIVEDVSNDVTNLQFLNCLFDTVSKSDVRVKAGYLINFENCQFSLGGTNVDLSAGVSLVSFARCGRGGFNHTFIASSDPLAYFIQEDRAVFVGPNLQGSTTWTNGTYSGFTSTAGKITAATAGGGGGTATTAARQTYKGCVYTVVVTLNNGATGQTPTFRVRNGNNTAYIKSAVGQGFTYVETVSGNQGFIEVVNTAAANWSMFYDLIEVESVRGYIDQSIWI